MTPDELRAALATCGWSAQGLAVMCGYSRNIGSDWATGRIRVPAPVAAWLLRRAEGIAADPPPRRAA